MTSRRRSSVRAQTRRDLFHDVVFHQLDDLNALGDALAAAARGNDTAHLSTLRASVDRFAVALGWNAEAALPAILAYVKEHGEFDDELFGPAFILRSIAPEHAQTTALLARLPQPVRDLLALVPISGKTARSGPPAG
jgi:hypothetical protein